jgi:RND family efflux transporter MFP subunit
MKKITISLITLFLLLLSSVGVNAEEDQSQGIPPALVVVSDIRSGTISPETEFIGTVYYQEVSDVASEVNGKVEIVRFEEGQRIKKGDVLVRLSSDLLKKSLQANFARYEQVLSDLEQAETAFRRAESLFADKLISEQLYDDRKFRVKNLEKNSLSLKADVERLEIELQKKEIRAPYNGVVLQKHVDRGEWLSPGLPVAMIAKDDTVDIVVEIPERVVMFIKKNNTVSIKAGGKEITGRVVAIVPKGNISTRTIPVKIRVKNTFSLFEGMEALVRLPVGEEQEVLTVHRDAVIPVFGSTVVFAVQDAKAVMTPVKVIGYKGLTAGIYAEELKEGMNVVVKGHERLQDGQAVEIRIPSCHQTV